MATYYWVGGTGNWSDATNHWSNSSGGSPNASYLPTSADDVIFDANSNTGTGAFTVTVDGTSASPSLCADFSTGGAGGALDGAMTLTMGATAALNVYGSWTNPATNFAWSNTVGATLTFASTATGKTITTNGVSVSNMAIVFDGVGGAWTLGSALTASAQTTLTVTNGTFSTSASNYSLTVTSISSSNSNTRTISLNASAVSCSGTAAITFTTSTNLTFNAGTSTITCSGASPTFAGGGQTFYNVSFTTTGASTKTITGANTFNNLTIASTTGTRETFTVFGANQTVNGTLTFGAANTSIRRIRVASDVVGTARTLTVATVATLADVDFRDITAAGASAPWSGTRLGDCLGNTSITFAAGVNKYWNLAAGGNWSDTAWALTSGGAVAANNFPLPQDTAIIENTGLTTGNSITFNNNWQIGNLDASTRTTAANLVFSGGISIYKNITLSTSLTLSGTTAFSVAGRGTQSITSAGLTFTSSVTIESAGTVALFDNLTFGSTLTFTLTSGTLDLTGNSGNWTLSTGLFSSSNSNTRAITFGTGNITLTGNAATVWTTSTATNFTYTGTPTVNATYSGSTGTRTIIAHATGATESNVLNFNITAGTDTVTLSSTNNIKNLIFTGFAGTWTTTTTCNYYGNLLISSGMTVGTISGTQSFLATSGTQQITTNGKTLDFAIIINGSGGTMAFQDALTQGSTRAFTITNGTVQFKAGTTNTVGAFATSGTNLKYLQSTTAGTQATITQASGTVTVTYLSIKDSNATGGVVWNASDTTNVNAGNNTGWLFPSTNFFLLFN